MIVCFYYLKTSVSSIVDSINLSPYNKTDLKPEVRVLNVGMNLGGAVQADPGRPYGEPA